MLDTPGLVAPYGICLSPDETTLAVACANSNCIKLVSIAGSVALRTIGGEEGSGDGQLRGEETSGSHQTGSSWWWLTGANGVSNAWL